MTTTEPICRDGTMSVKEAIRFTSLGMTTLYQLMDKGAIRFTQVGRRRLIPRAELVRLLEAGLTPGVQR